MLKSKEIPQEMRKKGTEINESRKNYKAIPEALGLHSEKLNIQRTTDLSDLNKGQGLWLHYSKDNEQK